MYEVSRKILNIIFWMGTFQCIKFERWSNSSHKQNISQNAEWSNFWHETKIFKNLPRVNYVSEKRKSFYSFVFEYTQNSWFIILCFFISFFRGMQIFF